MRRLINKKSIFPIELIVAAVIMTGCSGDIESQAYGNLPRLDQPKMDSNSFFILKENKALCLVGSTEFMNLDFTENQPKILEKGHWENLNIEISNINKFSIYSKNNKWLFKLNQKYNQSHLFNFNVNDKESSCFIKYENGFVNIDDDLPRSKKVIDNISGSWSCDSNELKTILNIDERFSFSDEKGKGVLIFDFSGSDLEDRLFLLRQVNLEGIPDSVEKMKFDSNLLQFGKFTMGASVCTKQQAIR